MVRINSKQAREMFKNRPFSYISLSGNRMTIMANANIVFAEDVTVYKTTMKGECYDGILS